MELSDYLRILRQRGWLIVLLAVLTAGAAFGFSKMQTPVYKASARLLITSRPDFGQTQAARAELRNYAAWLDSSLRAQKVIEELQLDMMPEQLMGDVTIAAATSESIIQLDVENTDLELAKEIARVWAQQLIVWRNEENAGLQKADWIEAVMIDVPTGGLDSPQTKINTAAGAVFGALLGVLVIFVLEWIESGVVRRSEDVERYLDIPVIGTIPGH
ncbi:MAG: Wzz/FepE/Etk N-terminal domain-containing protein [Chloroflexi bacterium]|nr:Wzz/FepE/Etk N-terminal domain-containing protein [Chloroflexota bacterium]MCI0578900.1 Wzz/FepE/Etk N-terminal domain-containing protein [Chloroflexota bacterium]MCI0643541.1 Wzz/FepE/Etk N-terminal domain-containing protein [Chloroflexota bacterium]MCI0727937.1 Wzz/FepE/Etk N-terminal domain-containing protein [Chloroflexota bacterium]